MIKPMPHSSLNSKTPPSSKALYDMTQLALAESANMIAQQSRSDIQFAVNSISVEQQHSIDQMFEQEQAEMLAIRHKVNGDRPGVIVFMLSEPAAQQLLQQLLNGGSLLSELTEMDEEALSEIGNIIVNNCLNHYVQIFSESVATSLPELIHRQHGQLLLDLYDETAETSAYVVKIDILLGHQAIHAYILWLGHLCQLDAGQAQ
jgi:chemotaxis protein CheC